MKNEQFKLLFDLIKMNTKQNDLCAECFAITKEEKVLVYDIGIFETNKVVSIYRDKIMLEFLKIQKHNLEGIDFF